MKEKPQISIAKPTTLDAISGTNITCTIVGNGIHLYRPTPFGVTTPETWVYVIGATPGAG